MNKFFLHGAAALCIAAFFLTSGLLWVEYKQTFPILPEGHYIGELKGETSFSEEESSYWSIWSDKGRYFTFLLSPEVVPVDVTPLSRTEEEFFPLRVPIGDETLFVAGRELDQGEYRGTFSELRSKKSGEWNLSLEQTVPDSLEPGKQEALLLWLHQRAEYDSLVQQRAQIAQRKSEQQAELLTLNNLLSDLEVLKEKGKEDFEKTKQELEETLATIKAEELELRRMFEQYSLARKGSKMGELLQVAREIRLQGISVP